MTERPEGHIIVCSRIADLARPLAPAMPSWCSRCQEGIWLGFAVQRDVPDGIPMCQPCVAETMDPDSTIVVTPEVRREAAAILRWLRGEPRAN